ncbi:Transcription initiation factor TFIID subunit like protein [Argiope bruennichi]|uniref:Transcription initiation factor TFIID subunit 13 n=1 Tax=Argiope bruennichi TaxID=94029 RepID=A0A8T0EMA2_ARGBR|nr:Transcription initiation factor TFIID subunit like protein [Argiope bruennichi]
MAATTEDFDQFEDDLQESQEPQSGDKRKRLFSKELRCMMYGFGDDQNPYTESVDLLEDLTHKAMEIGRTGRVQVEDIVFLVRKDPRRYARVKDLLTMNEELKKARKAFDEVSTNRLTIFLNLRKDEICSRPNLNLMLSRRLLISLAIGA